jgi:glycosyltransferase involved in cell wall biosynthesis
MKKSTPSISVVIPTFNSGKTLDKCLSSIRLQDYPQRKIDIILADGGSVDNTFEIARRFKAKIISVPKNKQNAEYNRGVAFGKAKGDLVLIYDHDNFLPNKRWIKKMVNPLLKHPEMVAVESCYYHYDRRYGLLDRYFALFGASEPLPIFMGKQDRLSWVNKKWTLLGRAKDMGPYYLVEFEKDPRKIPTIGTNGCLMRRKLVIKNANISPDHHYPIDVMVDVIKKGHNQFGFVKNSIIHLTGYSGFSSFLRRRKRFVDEYHFKDSSKRRYSVVMKGEWVKVLLYVIYSLTIVVPMIESLNGYRKIRDIAWFLHPILCVGTTFMYGISTIKFFLLERSKG